MSKTKKKKKIEGHELQLGNTEVRAGHRRDCSQLQAVVKVGSYCALSKQDVIELVSEEIDGQVYEIEVRKGVTIEVTFNAGRVTLRDVKEV